MWVRASVRARARTFEIIPQDMSNFINARVTFSPMTHVYIYNVDYLLTDVAITPPTICILMTGGVFAKVGSFYNRNNNDYWLSENAQRR